MYISSRKNRVSDQRKRRKEANGMQRHKLSDNIVLILGGEDGNLLVRYLVDLCSGFLPRFQILTSQRYGEIASLQSLVIRSYLLAVSDMDFCIGYQHVPQISYFLFLKSV